jgi:carbamoylphosphate synthase large subunit
MSARVLVLEAGSAASNNLIRSLKAGDPSLVVFGCNEDPFVLKKSPADRNYLLPDFCSVSLAPLRRIVKAERIDLVIPTNDADVFDLSKLRNKLGCRTFLPRHSVIDRCQDKYALTVFLRRRGIPVPQTYAIGNAAKVTALFRRFDASEQLWCRIRAGSGSNGAIPVTCPAQVRSWIAYWERMRAVPPGSFTLSEYLPGRDFCVQCLWDRGRLVLAKMAERITYIDSGNPSGVSSTPALAQTAFDPRILEICEQAVRALDADASGVFFVDLKENDDGEPYITEINAGRFATITNIHDLAGKHNMAVAFVRLALGRPTGIREVSDYSPGFYLVRSVDTLPAVVSEDELFAGLHDATG